MFRTIGAEKGCLAADLKVTFDKACDDRFISTEELDELEGKINRLYFLTEVENLARNARIQLENIPDSAPNRPLRESIGEIGAILDQFVEQRSEFFRQWQEETANCANRLAA